MTEPRRKRISPASAIGYGVALGAGVLGLLMRAVAAHAEGNSWAQVISVLLLIFGGILLLVFLLFEMFAWLDRTRTRELARTYPNAFIATVATDPTLVSGANALAHQLTGERTELVASTYVSVVADREEIRFFRGSRKPRQVAAFASSVIDRVELGSAQAGARVIPTLDLVCRAGATQGRISMHLIRFGRIVPRFVRDDSLEDAVRRFSAAAGSAGGHRLIREK